MVLDSCTSRGPTDPLALVCQNQVGRSVPPSPPSIQSRCVGRLVLVCGRARRPPPVSRTLELSIDWRARIARGTLLPARRCSLKRCCPPFLTRLQVLAPLLYSFSRCNADAMRVLAVGRRRSFAKAVAFAGIRLRGSRRSEPGFSPWGCGSEPHPQGRLAAVTPRGARFRRILAMDEFYFYGDYAA